MEGREDVATPLPLVGCLDSTAASFQPLATLHEDSLCRYAPPSPPTTFYDLIGLLSMSLVSAWLALWALSAGIVQCIDITRRERGGDDLTRPKRPPAAARRAAPLWRGARTESRSRVGS